MTVILTFSISSPSQKTRHLAAEGGWKDAVKLSEDHPTLVMQRCQSTLGQMGVFDLLALVSSRRMASLELRYLIFDQSQERIDVDHKHAQPFGITFPGNLFPQFTQSF
jgi:hypothetical protein